MIRVLLLFSLLAPLSAEPRHVLVYREPARFGGWPANHGIWAWGNEILVGFSAAWFENKAADRHQANSQKPEEPRLARSLDGVETWTIEAPPSLLPPEQGGTAVRPLAEPIDFAKPGFVLTLRYTDIHKGPSRLFYSYDKGKTWRGPFDFPLFNFPGVAARTDYTVLSKNEAIVFLTASKSNAREGRPFCARTRDGGLTWTLLSMLGPEPPGFAIMPSALRLNAREWLAEARVKNDPANWIEQFRSIDGAATWTSEGKIADTGAFSGNPPHLIRLPDGRLCLTYGRRSAPFAILSRISSNNGKTWNPERTLRADASAWDMGYVRSAVRPDGKVVTAYYYNDAPHNERFIAATIWDPKEPN